MYNNERLSAIEGRLEALEAKMQQLNEVFEFLITLSRNLNYILFVTQVFLILEFVTALWDLFGK